MKFLAAATRKFAFGAMLLICTFAATQASELPAKVGDTEVEIGDRLRIRAKVMSVDHIKQTLKVAEKEVRLLDTSVAGQTLKTRLLDEDGKPVEFGSFKEGEQVLVLGYSGPEGDVYAMKIQRVDPTSAAHEPASKYKSQLKRPKSQNPNPLQQSR
jgi:hypothetical protein